MFKSKEDLLKFVLKELEKGSSYRAISSKTGVAKSTLYDFVQRHRDNKERVIGGKTNAKIFLFDIETAPAIHYAWTRFKAFASESQVIQNGFMLTWAGKWLGDSEIHYDSIHLNHDLKELKSSGLERLTPEYDFDIVNSLADIVEEADYIVYHNGDRFDLPTLNARMAYWGRAPLAPSKTIDTFKIAKSVFRFPSNSLDSVSSYLGLGESKIETKFSLWSGCMEMEEESFEEMLTYNIQDNVVLQRVFEALAPYDRRFPNMGQFTSLDYLTCLCGSTNVHAVEGKFATTPVGKFRMYRCDDCGRVTRDSFNLLSKSQRGNTLRGIAR